MLSFKLGSSFVLCFKTLLLFYLSGTWVLRILGEGTLLTVSEGTASSIEFALAPRRCGFAARFISIKSISYNQVVPANVKAKKWVIEDYKSWFSIAWVSRAFTTFVSGNIETISKLRQIKKGETFFPKCIN